MEHTEPGNLVSFKSQSGISDIFSESRSTILTKLILKEAVTKRKIIIAEHVGRTVIGAANSSIGAACEFQFQGNPVRQNRILCISRVHRVRRLSGVLVILMNQIVLVTRSWSRLRYEEANWSAIVARARKAIGLSRWRGGELRNTAYPILNERKFDKKDRSTVMKAQVVSCNVASPL
ncbi:hypothetical protein BJY01DRAFT_184162 [Aspergillus pseudoustus]|uniref:Uncharacterized protein n=1 Tax=Aspergillus pseudoustus TaxID=1810923 RepID=A0ABR4JYC6_9EURO